MKSESHEKHIHIHGTPCMRLGFIAMSSSAQAPSNVNSDDLSRFVAIMRYIRSQPTPSDVKVNNIPYLSTLDTAFSYICITGFITPYTGETSQQAKLRLRPVPQEDRFTAVMAESYRLSPNPLLDIVHQLLPPYNVQSFTTAEDLNASAEFLKSVDIERLADGFDSADYHIPAQTQPQTVDDYIVWKIGDEVSHVVEAEAKEAVLAAHEYAVGIGLPRIDRPITIF